MIASSILQMLSKDKLSVFLFHKVPKQPHALVPGDITLAGFERMLDEVVSRFNVLPLEDAAKRLQGRGLPRRAACITFDDGYADWMSGVVPALRRRNLHATFFITTGQFASATPLWHERIQAAMLAHPGPLLEMGMPSLGQLRFTTVAERQAIVVRLEQELKYLTLTARERAITTLEELSGVRSEHLPRMSDAQVRDLHSQGFGVGGHTVNHPILDYCSLGELVEEVAGVREQLSAIVGGSITGFAYPNGRPHADFSRHHVQSVRSAGYSYAVTTHWGVANPQTSLFQIPRFTPWAHRKWHALFQAGRNLMVHPVQVAESAA